MPRPLFDHFGLLASFYDRVIHPSHPTYLLELLALEPGQQLLDVGGGTGRVTQYFCEAEIMPTIVDPSLKMLRRAQGKACCMTCQGLSESLPFADDAYVRVLAVDSFHHFWDHERAARELLRVLMPGGRMVIEEPDIRRFPVKLIALMEQLALMRSRFYPPDALAELFICAGGTVRVLEGGVTYWAVVEK
ncbi:MAG: class I SAM-dependent methyltransferase [Anaerolineae bacterium]|jgi:demethylmenaquinone methyltransferase/2-methoxy-6-polyprenyl-1,4-benzoquinol methylase|nr:class I SAM-dependent methyltransferase [Anaerolineae bacterium]